jgi:predicted amidophosphoribosyltransferase
VRFVYKINSGYDGFTPQRIPDRLRAGRRLNLGWRRYLENVDRGDEVWVYFHGPRVRHDGVYVKGRVERVSLKRQTVVLSVRKYSTADPLTDMATSRRIAEAVATKYRQVFILPLERIGGLPCTVDFGAETCEKHLCKLCVTWRHLPVIDRADYWWPVRLPEAFHAFVAAYWIVPSRCAWGKRHIGPGVRKATTVFYRFKMGERALAYPLALGVSKALRRSRLSGFDAIVPIPLSPHKARAGELHRTRSLARELAGVIGVRKVELLTLKRSISKRQLLSRGRSPSYFESRYYDALRASRRARRFRNILLVDDVCTEGRTLACALRRLQEANPGCRVSAATAGQMILKGVVRRKMSLRA